MPFQKGIEKVPGSGKKKGSKDQKTLAWERIGEYVIGEGADRYLQIIGKLPDKDFLIEFRAIVEYFKPKLQRTDSKIDMNSQLENDRRDNIKKVWEYLEGLDFNSEFEHIEGMPDNCYQPRRNKKD